MDALLLVPLPPAPSLATRGGGEGMSFKCLIGLHDWKCVASWSENADGKRVPVASIKGFRTKVQAYKCRGCGKTKIGE